MKLHIMLISALLSLSAFGFDRPYELEGKFSFQGEVRAVQVFSLTKVKANTLKGKRKLKNLINNGHSCQRKIGFTFYCEKREKFMSAPGELIEEVVKKFEHYNVVFKEPSSKPSLKYANKSLSRYVVDQKIMINHFTYPRYNYEVSADHHKILSMNDGRSFTYVARSPSQLEFLYDKVIFESSTNKRRYVFFIGLDKD